TSFYDTRHFATIREPRTSIYPFTGDYTTAHPTVQSAIPTTQPDSRLQKERARPVSGKDGRAPGMEGERFKTFCHQYNPFGQLYQ
ncbi:MAG: hypothetical protein PVF77_05925, partial [Anaerolineae bacterium]